MNGKTILLIAIGVVGASAATASASLDLTVKAAPGSRIYLNGRYRSRALARFANLRPGIHRVAIHSARTNRWKTFNVLSPARYRVGKVVRVGRRGRPVKETVLYRHQLRKPSPPCRRYGAPGSLPRAPKRHSTAYVPPATSRQKVRRRNAILAVAAANEVLNGSRSRKNVRKAALTATVVNEVFTR